MFAVLSIMKSLGELFGMEFLQQQMLGLVGIIDSNGLWYELWRSLGPKKKNKITILAVGPMVWNFFFWMVPMVWNLTVQRTWRAKNWATVHNKWEDFIAIRCLGLTNHHILFYCLTTYFVVDFLGSMMAFFDIVTHALCSSGHGQAPGIIPPVLFMLLTD